MEEVEKSTADVIAALLAENDALRAALAKHGYGEISETKANGLVLAASQPITVQDAALVLMADPDAVAKMARAYDREDSAQRGEADPHDGRLFPTDAEWEGERIACATAALRAIAEAHQ